MKTQYALISALVAVGFLSIGIVIGQLSQNMQGTVASRKPADDHDSVCKSYSDIMEHVAEVRDKGVPLDKMLAVVRTASPDLPTPTWDFVRKMAWMYYNMPALSPALVKTSERLMQLASDHDPLWAYPFN